jgi:hypothetical protein
MTRYFRERCELFVAAAREALSDLEFATLWITACFDRYPDLLFFGKWRAYYDEYCTMPLWDRQQVLYLMEPHLVAINKQAFRAISRYARMEDPI